MTRTIRFAQAAALAAVVGLGLSAVPAHAGPHGRGGFHGGGRVYVGGFYDGYYGYNPYFGYGPYFGPYAFGPYGYGPFAGSGYGPGGDMNAAMIAGQGALEMDVKPGEAEVWVDGEYVADARDLDGYPSYLWLKKGTYHIAIKRGGYATFEQDVDVRRGKIMTMKVRLQKGDAATAATSSDEKTDKAKSKSKDKAID
jgi:hypothetical protein